MNKKSIEQFYKSFEQEFLRVYSTENNNIKSQVFMLYTYLVSNNAVGTDDFVQIDTEKAINDLGISRESFYRHIKVLKGLTELIETKTVTLKYKGNFGGKILKMRFKQLEDTQEQEVVKVEKKEKPLRNWSVEAVKCGNTNNILSNILSHSLIYSYFQNTDESSVDCLFNCLADSKLLERFISHKKESDAKAVIASFQKGVLGSMHTVMHEHFLLPIEMKRETVQMIIEFINTFEKVSRKSNSVLRTMIVDKLNRREIRMYDLFIFRWVTKYYPEMLHVFAGDEKWSTAKRLSSFLYYSIPLEESINLKLDMERPALLKALKERDEIWMDVIEKSFGLVSEETINTHYELLEEYLTRQLEDIKEKGLDYLFYPMEPWEEMISRYKVRERRKYIKQSTVENKEITYERR